MARIDESLPFLPVRIAIITVSDTRTADNDTSGEMRSRSACASLPRSRASTW
jgi:molybdenum cofactor biosynthesis protein B